MVSVVTHDTSSPVLGLTASDFKGRFRDKPVRILSAERSDRANRAVIALDISGSMADPKSKFPAAQGLALQIVSYAPSNSILAFITFSEKVGDRVGFDHMREEIAQTIKALGSKDHPAGKGRTALRDAIMEALKLLSPAGPQDVIYVLSDGGDNFSKTDEQEVKAALRASGVRLYCILMEDLNPPTAEEVFGPNQLAQLAELTGGASLPYLSEDVPRKEEAHAQGMVRYLINRATESYILQFELPEVLEKRQGWKLEVGAVPQLKGGVRLFYPRELLPCTNPAPKY